MWAAVRHSSTAGRVGSRRDADLSSLPFLVGFAPPDSHHETIGGFRQVLHMQAHEFGAAEGAAEAEQQQGAVALGEQRSRQLREDAFRVGDQRAGSLRAQWRPQ
jgi:hypothetical protein